MSKHSYTNTGPPRSYENSPDTRRNGPGGAQNRPDTYESLQDQHDQMHIYEVANVAEPAAYETAETTADTGFGPISGGNQYMTVLANNDDDVAVPQRVNLEAKLPRRTLIIIVVGTLLLSTFISIISGIIVYHVTSSNVEDMDRSHLLASGSNGTGLATVSELNALRESLDMLDAAMDKHAELFTFNLSGIHDILDFLEYRQGELEKALYQHTVNHTGPVSQPSSYCQDGWDYYDNKCYLFPRTIELMYPDADAFCNARGSEMVIVDNSRENDWLKTKLISIGGNRNYLLGMTDVEVEGAWKWNDGRPLTFDDWHRGNEPNGGEAANCAVLWSYVDYQWVDEPCLETFNFICEKYKKGQVNV